MSLDQAYWEQRYEAGATGWDAGGPTLPLTTYIDQLTNKDIRILIPGAGNAYEAEYLFNQGFRNVFVLDLAKQPLDHIQTRLPAFPSDQLIQEDFFDHQGNYDLIIEQTFFCAIDPTLRKEYVQKCKELLNPGGKLVGLLWSTPMNENQPPFGGSIEEYRELFQDDFQLDVLEASYNSIKPRAGREAFIKLTRR